MIIVGGCTFSPHNENINPIKPPEPISFFVEVNDPNFTDPYYLISSTGFSFTLKDLSKPVIDYEVLLNDTHLGGGQDENIGFHMFPHGHPEGTHTVTIRIRIATQSGSLAEQLGAEFYLVEKSFKLIIDRTPPTLVNPPTASYENGLLTVRWNRPSKKNFYYVIKRTYQPYFTLFDTAIYNSTQDHFVDRGYVGGNITYSIRATGSGFEKHEMGSVNVNDSPVDFKVEVNDQRVVKLSWTKSLIDTENTRVEIGVEGRTISTPLLQAAELSIDTLVMAQNWNYFIKTIRDKYPGQSYEQIKSVQSERNLREFKSFAMLPQNNKLLIASSNTLYRYSLTDLHIEDSLTTLELGTGNFSSLVASEDEMKGLIVGGASDLIGFDPLNFDNRISYGVYAGTRSATGGDGTIKYIELGNVSNDGRVTMVLSKFSKYGLVYDTNTDTLEWRSSSGFNYLNTVRPPVISSDGNYLVYDIPATETGEVFQRSGDVFLQIGTADDGLKFFRESANELINTTAFEPYETPEDPEISIYDLTSPPAQPEDAFNKVRVFTMPDRLGEQYLKEIRYDRVTQLLYTRYIENAFSTLRLHDVNDFHQTGSVEAMTFTVNSHVYTNNYHLTSRGYIETVE